MPTSKCVVVLWSLYSTDTWVANQIEGWSCFDLSRGINRPAQRIRNCLKVNGGPTQAVCVSDRIPMLGFALQGNTRWFQQFGGPLNMSQHMGFIGCCTQLVLAASDRIPSDAPLKFWCLQMVAKFIPAKVLKVGQKQARGGCSNEGLPKPS